MEVDRPAKERIADAMRVTGPVEALVNDAGMEACSRYCVRLRRKAQPRSHAGRRRYWDRRSAGSATG
jgi:hypothetical protein